MDLYELAQDYLSDPSGALQALLTTFLNMVMLCEAEKQAGAGYYERSEHRTATRNGYTERGLKTPELKICVAAGCRGQLQS